MVYPGISSWRCVQEKVTLITWSGEIAVWTNGCEAPAIRSPVWKSSRLWAYSIERRCINDIKGSHHRWSESNRDYSSWDCHPAWLVGTATERQVYTKLYEGWWIPRLYGCHRDWCGLHRKREVKALKTHIAGVVRRIRAMVDMVKYDTEVPVPLQTTSTPTV